jgi:hypothetical protein
MERVAANILNKKWQTAVGRGAKNPHRKKSLLINIKKSLRLG